MSGADEMGEAVPDGGGRVGGVCAVGLVWRVSVVDIVVRVRESVCVYGNVRTPNPFTATVKDFRFIVLDGILFQ